MSELVAYLKKNPRTDRSSLLVFEVGQRERHFGMGGRATVQAVNEGRVSLRIPARMIYPGREYTLFHSDRLSRYFQLTSGERMNFRRINGYVTHSIMCLPDDPTEALQFLRTQVNR